MEIATRTFLPGFYLLLWGLFIGLTGTTLGFTSSSTRPLMKQGPGHSPLFEENQGQTHPEVRYLARGANHVLLLTPLEVVWALYEGGSEVAGPPQERLESKTAPVHFVRLRFLDMNPDVQLTPEHRTAMRTSYLRGSDPSQWQRGIASFRKVRYHDIYPGIDLLFYGRDGQLEYDFVVSPGTDPALIRLRFEGVESMTVSAGGDLVLTTAQGELRHRVPQVFQEVEGRRTEIGGRYRLVGKEEVVVGFEVDSYDRTAPLVIDPVLDFSTYFGASSDDEPAGVATDTEGNIYLAGHTGSVDFPLLNPFQGEFAGGGSPLGDVFVTKLDPTGSSVLYSTYIGGAGTDICAGIAVDSQGRAVVSGTTFSGNFPFTPGAFQTICSGLCPFVVRLSADGSQMSYGTFVGRGSGGGIAVDSLNQAVITGRTTSNPPDFPVKNAIQPQVAGGFDAFVSKLTSAGSGLVFSTYLGGTDDENLTGKWSIATDPAGNIYVTGRTESTDFPVQNAVQGAFGAGELDAFVTKLTPQGAVVYSTYLGGSDEDRGMGIDADADGNAYVAGTTLSRDFPTQDPFQANHGGGVIFGDAFVTKIAPDGGALVFSTYLGGESNDQANDIVVDALGRATVVGNGSSNFPVLHPLREFDGIDNYVTKFAADGSELVYSTPVGAGDIDVYVAASGTKILVAGNISSGSLPVLNALQPRRGGFRDAFLAQISDAGTLYFAQFGNGPGTISDLLPTGSEGSASMATVTYRDDEGNPSPVNVVVTGNDGASVAHTLAGEGVVAVEVPPLGLVRITTDGAGDLISGSVTVDFDNPIGGVIRFTLDPFGTAGVLDSPLMRGFLTPVRKNAEINTGVAVFNPEDHLVGITMRLRDAAGEQLQGGLRSTAIATFSHFAMFLDQLFPSVPDALLEDFEGTMTLETGSSNLITATVLELGGAAGQFTVLPVTPLP